VNNKIEVIFQIDRYPQVRAIETVARATAEELGNDARKNMGFQNDFNCSKTNAESQHYLETNIALPKLLIIFIC
jgi:hypothetical protein